MLKTIKQFFDKHLQADEAGSITEHTLQLATAALFAEMMRLGNSSGQAERTAVTAAIRSKFKLSDAEIEELILLAQQEAGQATDYYQFTSLINRDYTPVQKIRIIEHLWEVAFADQVLDKYEEHLVRKIADLLYVSHRDFIAAKLRAKRAAGLS